MLGAPPAFVLSQDQTLYKWYLSLKSVKSLFAQHAIACVLCELLCLELFNVFFQHENRFRYKFFDIVQFSRSCSASAMRLTTWLFYHRSDFLSSSFSKFFVSYRTWSVLGFSALAGTFGRLLVLFALLPAGTQKSFFCLSAWRSSIIPHPRLLVNTFCKFFQLFTRRLKSASSSCILQAKFFVFYNVLYKGGTV